MTNNPTIDGVSRDLLELAVEYLKIHGERSSIEYNTADDLQALLDAEPRNTMIGEQVGVLLIDEYFDNREVGDVDVQLDSGTCERLAKDFPGQSLALYIETPEVAALQSTIARLEAQLNNAINLEFQRRERITQLESEAMYAAATYQAARDRIAELESGRSEPVAYGCFGLEVNGQPCDFVTIETPAAQAEKAEKMMKDGRGLLLVANTPLFTAPPAPVAVLLHEPVGQVVEFGKGLKEVSWIKGKMPALGSNLYTSAPDLLLPARRTPDDFQSKNAPYDCADALADTWNACLDATAALNKSP